MNNRFEKKWKTIFVTLRYCCSSCLDELMEENKGLRYNQGLDRSSKLSPPEQKSAALYHNKVLVY
jgi:hypothetical protein